MALTFPPVAPNSKLSDRCPVRDVLDRVGDKWSLLVLITLAPGTVRFTEIKRSIGDVSQRMLAKTLRTLERDGYLSRKVYPTIPPKVEYSLTPLGVSLLGKIEPLVDWATQNHNKVREARASYVAPEAIEAL